MTDDDKAKLQLLVKRWREILHRFNKDAEMFHKKEMPGAYHTSCGQAIATEMLILDLEQLIKGEE